MKSKLRTIIKEKVNNIDKIKIMNKNNKIYKNFLDLEIINNLQNINLYISKEYEVDTKKIINYLLNRGKNLSVPYIDENDNMIMSSINSKTIFTYSKYNILVPSIIEKFDSEKIDCFIVPGISFSHNMDRVGRGKGYYDKFLFGKNAIKIGLCYEEQLINEIKTEKHDIPMDIIITERRILNGIKNY